MRLYLFLLVFIFAALNPVPGQTASNTAPKVVVSIKPIHSLVAGVMQGIGKPELLIRTTQSLHHYSLKPSDRRLLANADLIFWVGPELESFLPRLLESQQDKKIQVVSLIETKALTILPLRQVHKDAHQDHHDKPLSTDGHIWLNTHNAAVLVEAITQRLVNIDPANAQRYKANQKRLQGKIKDLSAQLHLSLGDNSQPFLSYHDAYQYFEHEFKLNNKGFVTGSVDTSPGARRILQLKKVITDDSIQCLFYDAPIRPAVIDTLLSGTNTRAIELDPAGVRAEEGEQAWFQIMQTMGKGFKNCLQFN